MQSLFIVPSCFNASKVIKRLLRYCIKPGSHNRGSDVRMEEHNIISINNFLVVVCSERGTNEITPVYNYMTLYDLLKLIMIVEKPLLVLKLILSNCC